jgi:hypothetical protein
MLGTSLSFKWPMIATAWGAAVWSVLQIHQWEGDFGHSICGPWGCGPPLQSLIACHGFWMVLLTPPIVVISGRLGKESLGLIGIILTLVGVLGMIGLEIWDLNRWWPMISEKEQKYLLERFLFSLAFQVDFPIVQLTLAGLGCLAVKAIRFRPARIEKSESPYS